MSGTRAVFGGLGLLLALTLAVAQRSPAVWDDRSWYDETYVFLEGMGIAYLEPWPGQFVRSNLDLSPGLGRVLHNLAHHDAYPPLVDLMVWSLRTTPHPLLALRGVFVALGLVLIAVAYRYGGRLIGTAGAACLALYLACSPMLTATGQELKWYAVAPLLAMLATVMLLQLERGRALRWSLYALTVFLLLNLHYFCLWLLPAHALFVWRFRPELRRPFAVALAAIVLALAPWAAWGLPRQLPYLRWHFETFLASLPYNSWYQPSTPRSLAGSWLYTFLAAIGWQPSPLRARYLLPVAGLAGWLLFRAARSADRVRREMALVSLATFGIALVGLTLYSMRLGQTTPLTSTYFTPWCPLLMVSLMIGVFEMERAGTRWSLAVLFVGGAAVNLVFLGPPRRTLDPDPLSHYVPLARALSEPSLASSAIVFRYDRDAKMVNTFYEGPARQMIFAPGAARDVPAEVTDLVFVSSAEAPVTAALPGWTRPQVERVLGHARIETARRVPAAAGSP